MIHHEAVTHEEYIDGKTITVVDKEAWDETIEHEATYKTVTVVDKEAYDETVHHDAETHEKVETVKEAWDESIRKENDFSDRQTSVCREIINGHIHGDISAEEYYTATINKAEYEIQGIGNIKGSLVQNLYKYADEYYKATGYSIWNLQLQTGNYEKNPIRSTNKDELVAFVNWANETNFFAQNGVDIDGELSVVTIKEETIENKQAATPGDTWEESKHQIGGDYTYDFEYWNTIAEGFKKLKNESIVVIENASEFLGAIEQRIAEGKVQTGNDGTIKHVDDPTGMDKGKSWIADVCETVFVYTGNDKLTIPGNHGSLNLGAIIAPKATIDFNTGEGAALVICDTLIANLQLHINLKAVEVVASLIEELAIHHEAETRTVTVVDKEAWDEVIHHKAETHEENAVDKEAWTEVIHHEAVTHEEYIDGKTTTVVDKEAWDETIEHEATYKTITVVDKEAWDEVIHHDAVTHEETVVDQEAYDETIHHDATYKTITVVDQEAYDETIHHDAVTHEEKVVDKEAWIEKVHHEAITHEEYSNGEKITVVDKEAWVEYIPHEATYKTITVVDQEAWDEVIHHDAVTHEEKVVDKEAWDEVIKYPKYSTRKLDETAWKIFGIKPTPPTTPPTTPPVTPPPTTPPTTPPPTTPPVTPPSITPPTPVTPDTPTEGVLGERRPVSPDAAVLGARRRVLGARRGVLGEKRVLGARTEDTSNAAGAVGVMLGSVALSGVWMTLRRKKKIQ